jgi:CheY-like chemotaxis protein
MTRVLLVEDDPMSLDMLARRLARKGFEVLTAVDGVAAVEMAVNEKPDLILMDLHLPLKDGFEATREIRAIPECQHLPIIALTASAMSGDRERCLEIGCDEYDTKPVNLERLLGKIELVLEK